MDIKTLFGKSRKSYALILTLLVLAVPLTLSGCGGGGGGSSSSTSSTISGTVDGGLSPISGSNVTLCEYNNSTEHFTGCPLGGTSLGSATTSASGSFSISYTPPSTGGSTVLYVDASGGKTGTGTTNDYIDLIAMAGSSSSLPSSLKVNELTTVAGEELFGFANGYTDPGNKNALSVFNDYYSSLVNVSSGNPAGSLSSSQTTIINAYKILANALAGCVQNQSVCSQIAKYVNAYNLTPPTTTLQIAAMIQEFQNVSANSTGSTMLENLYNIVVGSKLAQSTGWAVPSSAPATVPSLEIIHPGGGGGGGSSATYQYFNGGYTPTALAAPIADGGNVYDVDSAGGVSFTGYIYDNDPSSYTGGNLAQYITAVYELPTFPTAMAISASGNIWVINQGIGDAQSNGNYDSWVSKINPTGEPTGTGVTYIYQPVCQYDADNLVPSAIAIGPGGNIWVANEIANTIMELNTNCQLMTDPADTSESAYYYSGGTNPVAIAISAHDNIWVANRGSNNVVELSSSGEELKDFSSSNGNYTGTGPDAIAINSYGDVWVANETSGNVSEINPKLDTVTNFSVGSEPDAIAIDGLNNVWVANFNSNNITELSESGNNIGDYTLGEACSSGPDAIAIILGNVWVADNSATTCSQGVTNIVEITDVAAGDQYFPYSGPRWPGSF